jgi:hypothetical protein
MRTVLIAATVTFAAADVFVSPTGNDANEGTSPSSAVATLQRAAAAARATRSTVVHVASGTYKGPLTLSKEDSGVQWLAAGPDVRVSGGVELNAWTPSAMGPNIVMADVTGLEGRQDRHLYVGGVRARRTRYPETAARSLFAGARMTDDGFVLSHASMVAAPRGPCEGPCELPCAADHGSSKPCCGQGGDPVDPQYQCPASAPFCTDYVENVQWGTCQQTPPPAPTPPTPWPRGGLGVEFVYPQSTSPWTEPRCAVLRRNATHIEMMQPCWRNLVHKACDQGAKGPPDLAGAVTGARPVGYKGYVVAGLGAPLEGSGYIENVGPSSTMEPGDWALDEIVEPGKLRWRAYYALRAGETVTSVRAMMPTLSVLLNVSGGARDLGFVGFAFEYATWLRPGQADGYVEQQTGCGTVGTNYSSNSDCNKDYFWSVKSPGNVLVQDATNVSFVGCEFSKLGGFGLDLSRTVGCVIDGCYFHDISGSAIQIGQFQDALAAPLDRDNVVRNTIIVRAAAEYSGAAGLNVGYTVGTLLEHNDVGNLTYGAISVGWGWWRHVCAACTNAANNTIRFNRAHGYKQALNDGGGIYMLGPQNGSLIHGNWVYDQGTASSGALYPDEGSAYSTWSGNVVTNIHGSKWLHLWTSSIHDVVVRDNFADTDYYQNSGTNCPMINNTVFQPGSPPRDAQEIMDFAGVPKGHRWASVLR